MSQWANEVVCMFRPEEDREIWLSELGALLEYPKEVAQPRLANLIDYVVEQDKLLFEKEWNRLLVSRQVDFQCRFQNYRGERIWFRIHATPYRDPSGFEWILVAIRDVDKYQRGRDDMAECARVQAIESMAAGLSHEFNNHLTPIRGFIELSIEALGPDHELRMDLESALEKVRECADLIAHIQSYGGKTVLQPRPTELGRITGSLLRTLISQEGEAGQGVEVVENISSDLPVIMLDHNAYRQLLRNLVTNSLEAIEGSGTINLMIRSEQVDPASKRPSTDFGSRTYLRVRLIDSGEGIPGEDLKRIFDPFYTTRDRAEKRGIGLSVAQGIVRQHGGWMEIDSTAGVGTAVTMYFPVAETPTIQQQDLAPNVVASTPTTSASRVRRPSMVGRVLVGDDEDVIRQMVCKVFAREGWIVEEAHDYHEVLDIVENHDKSAPFDLMILDLTMPGPAATEENLHHIHKICGDTKILLMSGAQRDRMVDGLVEAFDSDFVKKPFSPSYLLEVVDELMIDTSEERGFTNRLP